MVEYDASVVNTNSITCVCSVFDAIYADSQVQLKALKVDGGGTNSSLMMQFQADIIGVDVIKPSVQETTALGAAFGAGIAVGVWKDIHELKKMWSVAKTWNPGMSKDMIDKNWHGWQKAVTRSLGWVEDNNQGDDDSSQFFDAEEENMESDVAIDGMGSKLKDVAKDFPLMTLMVASTIALTAGFLIGSSRQRKI